MKTYGDYGIDIIKLGEMKASDEIKDIQRKLNHIFFGKRMTPASPKNAGRLANEVLGLLQQLAELNPKPVYLEARNKLGAMGKERLAVLRAISKEDCDGEGFQRLINFEVRKCMQAKGEMTPGKAVELLDEIKTIDEDYLIYGEYDTKNLHRFKAEILNWLMSYYE